MTSDYKANDYEWIKELLDYPRTLEERLNFFEDTSQIAIPEDPIDRVNCAKQGTHSYGGKAGNR
jgi:Lon-like ATP-dependent protease